MRRIAVVGCVVALCAFVLPLHAEVIYTTDDPLAYNGMEGWTIYGPETSYGEDFGQLYPATRFQTPSTTAEYELTTIRLALSSSMPLFADADVEVSIAEDDAGLPGTVLDTITVQATSEVELVTADFSNDTVILSANTEYWVICSAPGDSMAAWMLSAAETQGRIAFYWQDAWDDEVYDPDIQGAFEVNANSVPEPCTLAIMALGALGLARCRRK
jgi:hypothetical protein